MKIYIGRIADDEHYGGDLELRVQCWAVPISGDIRNAQGVKLGAVQVNHVWWISARDPDHDHQVPLEGPFPSAEIALIAARMTYDYKEDPK